MACPESRREGAFFDALRSAVRYELDARMLILSDSAGVRAVFQAAEEERSAPARRAD